MALRFIAIYLPQYHPITENDQWWGKGFTEWTNVTKAKPLFKGHYQPRFPADLGYYDLRVPEVREAQAKMASQYGIEGFMYYHYWFGNGKRLLERPFSEVLSSGQPNFPFCLCWANESWKGVWHGEFTGKTLIEQVYPGEKDYINHFYELLPAFKDERYIRIDGKPLFCIYLPQKIPDLERFVEIFQTLANREGLVGLHLIGARANADWNPPEHGFSGIIGSEISGLRFGKWNKVLKQRFYYSKKMLRSFLNIPSTTDLKKHKPLVVEYKDILKQLVTDQEFEFDYYPCVIPNWDNTARVGNHAIILNNSTPQLFYKHLLMAAERANKLIADRKIIFIKSWNEWAEGNYLEPDTVFGTQYLEQVLKIRNLFK